MISNWIYALTGRKRFKILKIMKLFTIFMLVFVLGAAASTYSQNQLVTLDLHQCNVRQLFKEIRKQTGLRFVFNENHVADLTNLDVQMERRKVEEVLGQVFKNTNLECRFEDDVIFVVPRVPQQQTVKSVTITGKVNDTHRSPLPGVTIRVKGTQIGTVTDAEGNYKITLPEMNPTVLVFSFVGMKTVEVKYSGKSPLNVVLEEAAAEMEEVVVTGIFERKTESFTGSASTYKTEDLKMMGAQNVIQSLRTLDPAFHITPSNEFGSDPNRLPDIDIGGKTSVVNLEEEYAVDPNQPLFILDGFEVDLQTIVDLNMERVASVTILKDAASTAIYGSRAANGVVVVETKRPQPGQLRVAYNGDFSVTMPDLSDYNMMNAAEKLEFERLAGYYTNTDIVYQFNLTNLYNERLRRVQSGVDTYWLSEPVRLGFVHKHNLYVDGGDDAMSYGLGVSYASTDGVMKKSDRDVLGFNIDLRYRKGKFRFDNKFTLSYTVANNPPQAFSVYVQTNPYYEKDYEGSTPKYLDNRTLTTSSSDEGGWSVKRVNPLYNDGLNHLNNSKELGLRNNFQMEWRPVDGLVGRGRVSLSKSNTNGENFKSPFHTDFDEKTKIERGSYSKSATDRWAYSGDATVTYGKLLGEVHQLNAVAGWEFSSVRLVNDSYTAVGFPDDNVPNPAFANQYATESKPSYSESTSRSTSFYLNANYSFDNRYLLDFNFRSDGSSVFGTNKRFSSSWSLGIAWNIHNENFIGDWTDLFKLRFSVGEPGNQNFSSYKAYTTYVYNTSLQNLYGMGANVSAFGNPNLAWQKTLHYNLGLDLSFFNNYLKFNTDIYYKDTDPMLVTISVASSTGRNSYVTNLGGTETKGINFTANVTLMNRKEDRLNWIVTFNGRHQLQEYNKIGNKLDLLNDQLKKTTLLRYRDGGSPTDIWAVRSAGIDPMTGEEVFIKKSGIYTFDYDNTDEVVVGNTEAILEGVFGTTLYYKGFSLGIHLRYRWGADYFNNELYNRIENIKSGEISAYNQDKRALYDRWQKPGDRAQYRRITATLNSSTESYPKTDRYVQRENTISGESISFSYDFNQQKWLQALRIKSMVLRANMNDIFRFSTIRAERGTSYPFARTVSLSLNVTF